MNGQTSILITGSTGMIGSALLKRLRCENKILFTPSSFELDLRDQQKVLAYFEKNKPNYVFHLAAIVGGIHANHSYPAKFIFDNTQMHCNIIHAAHQHGVKKLLFPGSACTYPKLAPQPIHESSFMDGKIEPTNLAYATGKINGIIMCQAYARQYQMNTVIPMPTNAYGIGDNFDPDASHVIPALMKRFYEAKNQKANEVIIWGSGKPLREFIYVDDLADALIFLMHHHDSPEIINVGTMQEISIADLAAKIAKVVGFTGEIKMDTSKSDGVARKCLDSNVLFALGWKPSVTLDEGLARMYAYHFR